MTDLVCSSEVRTQKHARGNVKRANGRVTTGTSALLRCIQLPPSTMQQRRLSPVNVVNQHSVKSLTWNWPLSGRIFFPVFAGNKVVKVAQETPEFKSEKWHAFHGPQCISRLIFNSLVNQHSNVIFSDFVLPMIRTRILVQMFYFRFR